MVMDEIISKNYRQTEIGVIPKDWEVLSISKIGHIIDGDRGVNYPNTNDFNEDGFCLFLSAANVTKTGFRFEECQFITKEKDQSLGKGKLQRGDIVLTTRGTVGNLAFFDSTVKYQNIRLNSGMVIIRINGAREIVRDFFYQLCRSSILTKQIDRLTFGSAQPQLTVKGISLFQFPIPSTKAEQVAIATALSDVDQLITVLGKLIVKKRNLKLGVMQDLLTGKKRLPGFSGKWEIKKIGEIADITKGQGLSKGKLSPSGKHFCVLYGELFTTYREEIIKVMSRTDAEEGRLSKHGDVLLPGSTTTIGIDLAKASALLVDDVLLGGDINIIRQIGNIYNPTFLAYSLTYIYRSAIAQRAKGITIYHLHGKDLYDLGVRMPDCAEQTAIAQVLIDIDTDIEQLEQKLAKYRMIKQGMMQELLNGKTRLM